jgi:phosphatidylinositol glycan class V
MFYRNVGFLKYWTLSNVPLFLLASPMLAILVTSSLWTLNMGARDGAMGSMLLIDTETHGKGLGGVPVTNRLLRSLAVPQFVLAVLALTNYHVQIITRISSGYCIWYFWLSALLIEATNNSVSLGSKRYSSTAVVKYLVMYAFVQGGLYSSFLPPA